jgi:O-acetyl-ADP-ribose deacetylase (regulator of RNase III)
MLVRKTRFIVKKGDITKEKVDAIVNAANSSLRGGGGVDGAIHKAAGPELLKECVQIRSGCPTGEAVSTGAGSLSARYVIHTVGPVWQGGARGEPDLLFSAYTKALEQAICNQCKTIAIPCISTGVYRYPKQEAAKVAITAVKEFCGASDALDEVRFIVHSDEELAIYVELLE